MPVADPASQPQWTTTTLPYAAIVAAQTGRFPVYDNTSVTEIPAGGTRAVVRPDGPTAGSTARAGGGGDYLSNEIAYRATLLRDRLGLHDTLPGGHVHTPVLQFGAGNTDRPRGGDRSGVRAEPAGHHRAGAGDPAGGGRVGGEGAGLGFFLAPAAPTRPIPRGSAPRPLGRRPRPRFGP